MKVVRPGETFSATSFEDDARNEPAILAWNAKVTIGKALRNPSKDYVRDDDPPLAKWFDGSFLPKLGCDFSHHDFARAFIVAMGSCDIRLTSVTSDVAVLVLPNPDGTYGTTNVSISYSKARFGVMASGQKTLNVRIANSTQLLYADEIPGHAYYGNVCRVNGKPLGVRGGTVTIGKNRALTMAQGIRKDHVTFKAKSGWDMRYQCYDDRNPCGAIDLFDSSGFFDVDWAHLGGDAMNNVFTAFRIGSNPENPQANGKACLMGAFDCSKAPDQTIPNFRLETKLASFATCRVKGGGQPSVYGIADSGGVALEIVKT